MGMPAEAEERLRSYSLEHDLFLLAANQQPRVAGKHPNTWESTCLSTWAVIWYSSKWLSRSPGRHACAACFCSACQQR